MRTTTHLLTVSLLMTATGAGTAWAQSQQESSPATAPATRSSGSRSESMTITAPFGGGHRPSRRGGRADFRARPVWLGVQLIEVPQSLAVHLGLEETGVMIGNIALGSPAEKAGLDRYDILIEADGEPIRRDIHAFIRFVQAKKGGDKLRLVYLRQGERREVSLTLARPGESARRPRMKYDTPDNDRQPRGHIFRRGPDGWILEGLGPIDVPPQFEQHLEEYMQNLMPEPEDMDEIRRVDEQGNVLHIERKLDGSYAVQRFHEGMNRRDVETRMYPNLDALSAGDPEAAALIDSTRPGMPCGPTEAQPGPAEREDWFEQYQDQARQWWRHELPRQTQEAWERWERQLDEYQEALGRWHEKLERSMPDREDAHRWQEWYEKFFQGPMRPMRPPAPPEPRLRFHIDPDGRIEVQQQRGNVEINRVFENERQLAEEAPELYERFMDAQRP